MLSWAICFYNIIIIIKGASFRLALNSFLDFLRLCFCLLVSIQSEFFTVLFICLCFLVFNLLLLNVMFGSSLTAILVSRFNHNS